MWQNSGDVVVEAWTEFTKGPAVLRWCNNNKPKSAERIKLVLVIPGVARGEVADGSCIRAADALDGLGMLSTIFNGPPAVAKPTFADGMMPAHRNQQASCVLRQACQRAELVRCSPCQ